MIRRNGIKRLAIGSTFRYANEERKDMLRKIRMIVITVLLSIIHLGKLKMKGFQDIRFDTEFAIQHKGHVTLGKSTTAFRRVTFAANGGVIEIGNGVFFNRDCMVCALDRITIGDRCLFGPKVIIYDHDHVFNENGLVSGKFKTSPVIIEDHCWIGANVTILRGTHIGEGCVIGAGAIVSGNIPPHSIVKSDRSLYIQPIESR